MEPERPFFILAVDPGRQKCGVAVLRSDGACVHRTRVATPDLAACVVRFHARFSPCHLLVGDGTGHRAVLEALAAAGLQATVVPEAGTTEQARGRYFCDHPPTGWRRLLPRGLLVPPEPLDDYAALLIAEAFLSEQAHAEITSENSEGHSPSAGNL